MRTIATTVMLGFVLLTRTAASEPTLPEPTLDGWHRYIAAVEERRRREDGADGRFLVIDQDRNRVERRGRVMTGELVVSRVDGPTERGRVVSVPGAMVHHWQGAVLLRDVTLDQLMARLHTEAPPTSPDVLRSSVMARGPSWTKVYMRLQRTKIVTAVYDTEHDVTFVRVGPRRAESRSVATRIVELADPGTPDERALAPGEDRGFLWRLNAYWRYEQVAGGVIAECESVSLSRPVPFGLGAIAGPIIGSTARESMERTLESLRDMVR